MSMAAYILWQMDKGTCLSAFGKESMLRPGQQTPSTCENRKTYVGVCRWMSILDIYVDAKDPKKAKKPFWGVPVNTLLTAIRPRFSKGYIILYIPIHFYSKLYVEKGRWIDFWRKRARQIQQTMGHGNNIGLLFPFIGGFNTLAV